jgi:hypothetical protein
LQYWCPDYFLLFINRRRPIKQWSNRFLLFCWP